MKAFLTTALLISLFASDGLAEVNRKPNSYSDQEIGKNETEKFFAKIGVKPRNVRIKMLNKTESAAKAITTPANCQFNRNDYWYAYGLDGGCGVNAGNQAGLTSAMFEVNKKIQCTLGGPIPSNCTVLGTMEADGLNGCPTDNPVDSALNPSSGQARSIGTPGKTQTIPGNVCLTPTQLENIRKQWTSINPMPGMKVLQVFVGGYPGINCMGGWGVTVSFGTCATAPGLPSNPID